MSVPVVAQAPRCRNCGRFASASRSGCRHCSTRRSTTSAQVNDPLDDWDSFQAAEGQALADLLTALD